jgi:hypothetical protein
MLTAGMPVSPLQRDLGHEHLDTTILDEILDIIPANIGNLWSIELVESDESGILYL